MAWPCQTSTAILDLQVLRPMVEEEAATVAATAQYEAELATAIIIVETVPRVIVPVSVLEELIGLLESESTAIGPPVLLANRYPTGN